MSFWASSACDSKVTLGLGGGESLDFGGKGDARRDGGLERGLEVGVLMVGVGVLEGYLAADVPIEASNFLSGGIHAGQTWSSAIAKGMIGMVERGRVRSGIGGAGDPPG